MNKGYWCVDYVKCSSFNICKKGNELCQQIKEIVNNEGR